MGKLARKRKEASGRKSARYGEIGRKFEEEVERLLNAMKEEGVIADGVRHAPNSPEDQDGRDFTVAIVRGKERVERSFGVTISYESWNESRIKHPHVPQMCFPINTKPETIRRRILELFNAA